MSERPMPHPADAMVGEHGKPDDPGDEHGPDDDGHAAETIGPVDVQAWAMAALGVVLGLVVVFALIQAAG